jgi:hypothetical protein
MNLEHPSRKNDSMRETGITSEVFTTRSSTRVKDVIQCITEKKSEAAFEWIKSLDLDVENSVIFGAYMTGIELASSLKEISNVSVVDIYPHMKSLVENEVGTDVKFYSNIDQGLKLIKAADLVVDTTGLGGLKPEAASAFNGKIFLVEDPTSDGSDKVILKKNNIKNRIQLSNADHMGILKTRGLNTKTSGTMTLTIETLRKSLENVLQGEGVLYGVVAMDFYEGILFKEKNVQKFLKAAEKPALTVSSLTPVQCDDMIQKQLSKLNSKVEYVSI